MNLKTPFLSKPFISLYQDSVNGGIVYLEVVILGFVGVLLININISAVFYQSLISGCCVCFNFWRGILATGSSIGSSVGSLVSSLISSSVSSSSTSSLNSSNSSYRYSFTTVVLKLVGLLGSCTLHVFPSIPSNLNRPVYLPLYLVLSSHYISISELRGRSWIIVTDGPFYQFSTLLTYFFALILEISFIAFFMAAACYIIEGASGLSLLI